jgi:hypothetical protein
MSAESEIVELLNQAGFPDVFPHIFARRLSAEMQETNDIEFWEWPVFFIRIGRCVGADIVTARQRVAQLLLDAGYRGFESIIKIWSSHSVCAPAQDSLYGEDYGLEIVFMDGIQRYTPEQIDAAMIGREKAQLKQAECQERAKIKRQLKSLDNGLRKAGLIE